MNGKQINKTLSFSVSDMIAKKLFLEQSISTREEMKNYLEKQGFTLMSTQGNSIYNSFEDILNGFKSVNEIPNININF
jgi:hypothetical protein